MDTLVAAEEDIETLKKLAEAAERAERYEDMCVVMKRYVAVEKGNKKPIDKDQRNQLSVAYKNVVGGKRSAWRTLQSTSTTENPDEPSKELASKYRELVEKELEATCLEAINIVKPLAEEVESDDLEAKIFYYKMLGDYYRYIAEFKTKKDNPDNNFKKETEEAYKEAMKLAKAGLAETHPTRLGLALNFSVCYYEILSEVDLACKLAKEAFDAAIEKLDTLNDNSYKDSTLIMQLLRDNLTLWTSESNDGGKPEPQQANP